MGTASILVVDDSQLSRKYLEAVLRRSGLCGTVLLAADGKVGLELLRREPIDLVLCDVNMPEVDGYDFLAQKRAHAECDEIPVIMLTGEDSLDSRLRCLRSGASDYLAKPYSDEELVARAGIHLQLKDLRDQLRSTNEQLRRLACLDSLTGIPNRHHFLENLKQEVSRTSRHGLPLCLGMVDIDRFKEINDTYGHPVGDAALTGIAALLKQGLREHDHLGRYGGEEFGVVFVNTDAEGAKCAAERCRRAVEEHPIVVGEVTLEITVSVGVAVVADPTSERLTELISRADEALYLAKHRGRNQVVLAAAEVA